MLQDYINDIRNNDFQLPTIIEKGWGKEIIFANNSDYCGKILIFNPNAMFSFHYHLIKDETWYVRSGIFTLRILDTTNATLITKSFKEGDIVNVPKGLPHQLIAGSEGGEIIEVSTTHFDYDSYRIAKGDSQKD